MAWDWLSIGPTKRSAALSIGAAALALALLAVVPLPALPQAKAQGDPHPQPCELFSDATCPAMTDWLGDFYRGRAQRRPGIERRLENGVIWQLEADALSGLALPRLVAMPDGVAMARANRLLQAMHGLLLVEYAASAGAWYEAAQRAGESSGRVPSTIPHGQFLWQPQPVLRLTYATSRLVSLEAALVEASEGNRLRIFPRGYVLDLDTGRIYEAERCANGGLFRLGPLIDICDEPSRAHFLDLWTQAQSAALGAAAPTQDSFVEFCAQSLSIVDGQGFAGAVHLTPAGLGVNAGRVQPNAAWHCLVEITPVNPVILPWRALAPLLKPSPWRNELLK